MPKHCGKASACATSQAEEQKRGVLGGVAEWSSREGGTYVIHGTARHRVGRQDKYPHVKRVRLVSVKEVEGVRAVEDACMSADCVWRIGGGREECQAARVVAR